ncbi:MAG: hypothetical protein LIO41_06140 [Ruminococcus sp.]|nr:hypothetical protein [Ruminococcus sp.]
MLKGVTKRQIILLYVLVAFLVAVLAIRYAIIPMMESNSEKNAELTAKMSEYDSLVIESQQSAVYETLNEQLEADIAEVSESFQSDLKTSNIDAKISELIKESGLSAVSLTVNDPVDVTDASLSADSAADAETKTQSGEEAQTSSTVKSITSSVTTAGTYDELVKLIELVGEQEAMYMTDLTFTMQVDDNKDDNEITMNFSIVSFVYTPQEDEEEAEG